MSLWSIFLTHQNYLTVSQNKKPLSPKIVWVVVGEKLGWPPHRGSSQRGRNPLAKMEKMGWGGGFWRAWIGVVEFMETERESHEEVGDQN